jgi:outer membrane protein TolC
VTQPIFQGGALRAKRRAAIDGLHAASAQYQQTLLQAFQNVADSLRALDVDANTLHADKAAEVSSERVYRITNQRYQLGGVSYSYLLTTQEQYLNARISSVRSEATRYVDTAALFEALGGGWWNRTKPCDAINSTKVTKSEPK